MNSIINKMVEALNVVNKVAAKEHILTTVDARQRVALSIYDSGEFTEVRIKDDLLFWSRLL